jgi:succinyl-diaminopimelate desuccinylase
MSTWEDTLLAAVDERADELLGLAGDLIRIPSENPPGEAGEIGGFIARYLAERGLATSTHDAGDGQLNVVARAPRPAGSADRHLVLCGHADVVPVGDRSRWDFDPFAGDVVDGYIRGRGASDMKAGLAGILFVAGLLAEHKVPLGGELTVLSVPDEETGGVAGVPWVLDQGIIQGATAAVIAEPSGPANPTIGQKGSCQFEVHLTGEPGHGSLAPMSGQSAIVTATRAIEALQGLFEMRPEPLPADLREAVAVSKRYVATREQGEFGAAFDHATINIGTIAGGTAINVVADRCVFTVDSRVPFGLTRDGVLAQARRLLDEAGIQAEFVERGSRSEANWTPPTDPIVATLVGAVTDVVDPDAYGVLQWATSDARWFRRAGVPVLQYGPAYLPSIHGFNERAPVEQVINAAKVYALTAVRYLGAV